MVTGYAVLENKKYGERAKMDFYLYQGESGAIYMSLGDKSFCLTKEQIEKLQFVIDFYSMVEDFNNDTYNKYYKIGY